MSSFLFILIVSLILVITGIKRQPGVGILGVMALIGVVLWRRSENLTLLGFGRPDNWTVTILTAMLLGEVLALGGTFWLEPLLERLTGEKHDLSLFNSLRGNFKALLLWLVNVWVLVAFIEEAVFRGFLMTEARRFAGDGFLALAANLLLSSLVFGLAHWYQGKSGALSTGLVGLILGLVYIATGFNLWLPILIHGFIDTIGLTLIYLNVDVRSRNQGRH